MNSALEHAIDLPFLAAAFAKITIILMTAWGFHVLARRANARWRVLLWRAAIVAVASIFILDPMGYLEIPVRPAEVEPAPSVEPIRPIEQAALFEMLAPSEMPAPVQWSQDEPVQSLAPSVVSPSSQPPVQSRSAPPVRERINWRRLILSAYLSVLLVLVARIISGIYQVRRAVASSPLAPDRLQLMLDRVARELGYERGVSLRHSSDTRSPFLANLREPTIVLPKRMIDPACEADLPAVFAHEVSHLVSHDLFWMGLSRWAGAFLWFHPLVWRIQRAHHVACEEHCDASAADYIGDTAAYSGILARVALAVGSSQPQTVGMPMAHSSDVGRRLRSLKLKAYSARLSRSSLGLCFGLFAGLVLMVGGLRIVHSQEETSAESEKEARWTVELSDGLSVDLVGVSKNPSEGEIWWSPNGNKMDAVPYDSIGHFVNAAQDSEAYEFCLRLVGSAGETATVTAERHGRPLRAPRKDGELLDDLRVLVREFPLSEMETSLRLGIASGPWTSADPDIRLLGGTTVTGLENGEFTIAEPYMKKSLATVTITHSFLDVDSRLIAIDKSGAIHEPVKSASAGADTFTQTTVSFALALNQIDRFDFQFRPYEWIEFPNVSLEQGHLTASESDTGGTSTAAANQRAATGNTIRGTVLRWDDRSPVEGAMVFLHEGWSSSRVSRETRTNAEGGFEFLDAPKTIVYLTAVKPQLNLTSRTGGSDHAKRLNLRHSEDTEHELAFLLGPGRIADVHVLSDETGEPIAGASVNVLGRPPQLTDASGYTPLNSLSGGWRNLEANAPGYAIQTDTINLSSTRRAHTEIRLRPGGTISGRAIDERGRPVAGLRVRANAILRYQSPKLRLARPYRRDTTGADGSFKFDSVPLDAQIAVFPEYGRVFSTTRYRGMVNTELTGSRRHAEVELKLSPRVFTGTFEGKVVDAGGAPIEGARVTWGTLHDARMPEALTDSRGKYRLDHIEIPLWRSSLYVDASGYAPSRRVIKPGTPDKPVEVDFALKAGHWIEGRIVDPEGNPLEGVWLQGWFWGSSLTGDKQQFTGPDGRFRIDSAPGRLGLDIRMEGYASENKRNVGELDRDIGDVVLRPLSEITGQVVDAETGKPIERFSVRTPPNNQIFRVQGQEFSSDQGLFQLGGLHPERELALTIRAPGYETTVFDSIAVPGDKKTPPVYELPVSSQFISGVVLDEEGRAVPDAEVTLIVYSQTGRQRSNFSWSFLFGLNVDALLFESLLTDSEGIFRFDGLPAWPESAGKSVSTYPYQVDIFARKSGYAKTRITELEVMDPEQWKNMEIEVASGETLTVDVDLALLPKARNVHLHRKDRLGIQGSERETQRLSDGSTQVTFEDLKPGDYVLVVSTDLPTVSRSVQKAVAEVTVRRGESATAIIPQAPSATLRGRATLGGKVIKRGTLSLSRNLFGISFVTSVRLNSNGEYSFDYIQPGSYSASANMGAGLQTPSASPYDLTVDISEGENVRDLEFKPAAQVDANTGQTAAFTGSIKGRVTDREGAPIEGARVVLGQLFGVRSPETLTDAGGNYLLDGLEVPPRNSTVFALASGYAPDRIEIEPFTSDPIAQVDFSLGAGHWIEGRIVDPEGNPIEGVWLEGLFWGGTLARDGEQTTGPDGRFRIDSAPTELGLQLMMKGYAGQFTRTIGDVDRDIGDLTLARDSEIMGQVVDAETGNPIKRFSVREVLRGDYTRPKSQEITSDDGLFELGALGSGREGVLVVRADGYEATVFDLIPKPAGDGSPPVYELKVGGQSLYGMVLDDEGRAVPGADVTLVVYREKSRQRSSFSWGTHFGLVGHTLLMESRQTDAEGIFSFDGLPARPESAGRAASTYPYPVDIFVRKPGHSNTRVTDLEVMDGREWKNLVVEMAPGATLTVDVDLAMVPGARQINLEKKDRTDTRGPGTETRLLRDGSPRVTFEDLQAGQYVLVLYAGSPLRGGSVQSAVGEVTIAAGERSAVNVPDGPSATLGGKVLIGGQLIRKGSLILTRTFFGRPLETAARLNSRGGYSFEYIAPGSYIASVRSGSQLWSSSASPYDINIDISEGENARDFEFATGARVVGRLENYTGESQGRVSVRLKRILRSGARAGAGSDLSSDGRFTLKDIPEGTYNLNFATDDGARLAPLTKFKVEHEQVKVDLGTLALPTGSFGGRIIGLPPAKDAHLLLTSYSPDRRILSFHGAARLDAEGRFRFTYLRGGPYVLKVRTGQSSWLVSNDVQVPEDGEIDLGDIDIGGGGSILVRLTGGLATGRSSSQIIFGQVRPRSMQVSDPDFEDPLAGVTFEANQTEALIEHIPAGEVAIRVSGPLCRADPNEAFVVVTEGETTEVEIRVEPTTMLNASVSNVAGVASAVMTNDATGEKIEFETFSTDEEARDAFVSRTTFIAMLTNNSLVASGLPPGSWRLEVTDVDGRTAVEQVNLILGERVRVEIEFRDEPRGAGADTSSSATDWTEQEVRNAVSRVLANMRALGTALETYHVDNNAYPPMTADPHNRLVPLTTPIAYTVGLYRDPFGPIPRVSFGYAKPDDPGARSAAIPGWIVWSAGPDRDYDLAGALEEYNPRAEVPSDALIEKTYDPTNGFLSDGDVWRLRANQGRSGGLR